MHKRELIDQWLASNGILFNTKDDEPVFVIVGRDIASTAAIEAWAAKALELGSTDEKVASGLAIAREMEDWRLQTNAGKVPD